MTASLLGLEAFKDGVPFIQTMVGLFAVSQVLILAEQDQSISKVELAGSGLFTGFKPRLNILLPYFGLSS